MLLSIMDSNSMPDHCRYNGRRSGPGYYYFFFCFCVKCIYFS
nr:ribosomal protein S19 [Prunus kansuensis]